jgi:hypothetical protein
MLAIFTLWRFTLWNSPYGDQVFSEYYTVEIVIAGNFFLNPILTYDQSDLGDVYMCLSLCAICMHIAGVRFYVRTVNA